MKTLFTTINVILALTSLSVGSANAGNLNFNYETDPQLKVLPSKSVVALYTVTNNSGRTLRDYRVEFTNQELVHNGIVSNVTDDPNYASTSCATIFSSPQGLSAKKSCTVKFLISNKYGNANFNAKTQFAFCNPSNDCVLNASKPIDVTGATESDPDLAKLSVTPHLVLVPKGDTTLVITNTSGVKANNVDIDLSAFNGQVTRTRPAACDNIAPGGTCTITLYTTANATFKDGTAATVQGGNTTPYTIETELSDAVTGDNLYFANQGTQPLTITNSSENYEATHITVTAPADGSSLSGIRVRSSTCGTTLAAHASCTYQIEALPTAYSINSANDRNLIINYQFEGASGEQTSTVQVTVAPAKLTIYDNKSIELSPNKSNQVITVHPDPNGFAWHDANVSLLSHAHIFITASDCTGLIAPEETCFIRFSTDSSKTGSDTLQLYGLNLPTNPVTANVLISAPSWVAVGGTDGISTALMVNNTESSGTGINWTQTNTNPLTNITTLYTLSWNGNIWLATGLSKNKTSVAISNSRRDTSTSWQILSAFPAQRNLRFYDTAWNGNSWVAVGSLTAGGPGAGTIYVNDNADASGNWTQAALPVLPVQQGKIISIYAVAWNGQYWLAAGNIITPSQNYNAVLLSNHCANPLDCTWQVVNTNNSIPANTQLLDITWNDQSQVWAAVGQTTIGNAAIGVIFTNTDPGGANSWQQVYNANAQPEQLQIFSSIATNGTTWVAVGNVATGGSTMKPLIVSNNTPDAGSGNWVSALYSGTLNNVSPTQVIWNGNDWVIVGTTQNMPLILTSNDPNSKLWTIQSNNPNPNQQWMKRTGNLMAIASSWSANDWSQSDAQPDNQASNASSAPTAKKKSKNLLNLFGLIK